MEGMITVAYSSRLIRLNTPMMQGPDVLEVQKKLARLGFDSGTPDGIYDESTANALRRFQDERGLKVDGLVGPLTWKELNKNDPLFLSSYSYSAPGSPKIHIHVDTRILTLTFRETIRIYPVGVGKPSTPSPVGNWIIIAKEVNPDGPFGVRWMKLNVPWGSYGIHGTNNPNSIGRAFSHGCIRLYNEDVTELYDLVWEGVPVSITGKVRKIRNLKIGDRGKAIRDVQEMLYDLSYFANTLDGYYGKKTGQAVIRFQEHSEITPNGIVGKTTLKALQIAHDLYMNDTNP